MELFDFIKTLFDRKAYQDVPENIKKKHAFMAMRFISINHPIEANQFNKVGINQVAVMDSWNIFLSGKYTKVPNWVYTKVDKKTKVEKGKIEKTTDYLNKENMLLFSQESGIEMKDLRFLIDDLGDETTWERIKALEEAEK